MNYFDALCDAMGYLGKIPDTIFMGQGVGVPGTTMSPTFDKVSGDSALEMPVAEEMQLGMAIGMSLYEFLPICIFPRWSFVLRAADALVNHLDRLPLYSSYMPKVIIRVAAPSNSPFYAGPQHDDDFSEAFRKMLRTVRLHHVLFAEDVVPTYRAAVAHDRSTIIVEHTELYRDARAAN